MSSEMIAMEETQDQLELDSRLSEQGRVWQWVEAIADRRGLSPETRFAIHLCLEEALANTVIHGYRSQPGNPILLSVTEGDGKVIFVVEDQADPFVPPEPAEQPSGPPPSLEDIVPGGNGIRLMRQFATAVTYEPLPAGNRLTLVFPGEGSPGK
jgi:anti-sigma regulatory factor (Ser/Thr protein kinase)